VSLFSLADLRNLWESLHPSLPAPLGAPSSLSSRRHPVLVSWSKLFCSVSRPGAQCDIYGFLLGPCVEPAIILERERGRGEREREREREVPSLHFRVRIQVRSVVHMDVKLQPTTTTMTTMTMATAVKAATTRVYEYSASGIVFLHLLFFEKRMCMLGTLNGKDRKRWRKKERARILRISG